MIPQQIQDAVIKFLSKRFADSVEISSSRPVSGGSINQAFQIKTNHGSFFLKYNDAARFPQMFEKEAKGLSLLRSASEIDIPEVIYHDEAGQDSFLLLQFIDSNNQTENFWEDFGVGR